MNLYDSRVAAHYSAYRPALHQVVLSTVLQNKRFSMGLDVGCGTGRSTVALKEYCEQLVALDPSPEMLALVPQLGKVSWMEANGESTGLDASSMDVITLAGCLHYCDKLSVAREMARVAKAGAPVLVYDFEVLIDEFMAGLELSIPVEESGYDHRANFADFSGLKLLEQSEKLHYFEVEPQSAVHLLLSSQSRYDSFRKRGLSEMELLALLGPDKRTVEARLFYSLYEK